MTRADTDAHVLVDLLASAADGDVEAFADLYDRTSARVYGMVLRVLRDPGYSEETTQEVYLQVWRGAARYDPAEGSPVAWLLSIAHRRAVDRVRSETSAARRESDYGARELTSVADYVGDEVQARDDGRRIRNCLGTLSERQAEAVGLAYYGGLSYSEVAERLTVGLPAVKSRIRDGLRRLRGCLENG
ncbi:ECF RNA polymerase sigma factor SigK [Gordonia spumicola]|uniref:ECF RNA polymerase sigma factor SigK n=1 Tax=Gordonia spumicola TaxID=589161 RepID=A0A7I9V4B5_9ACTN|nr:ECF RNA polymerase sigma factor SigK [Gordonia spumicola]GED99840.1 ECF RNA polymerase sigma factor SigK [Gordonia spumicola]